MKSIVFLQEKVIFQNKLTYIILINVTCNFNQKETTIKVFSCELWEIFKNIFHTQLLWKTTYDWKIVLLLLAPTGLSDLHSVIVFAYLLSPCHISALLKFSGKKNEEKFRKTFSFWIFVSIISHSTKPTRKSCFLVTLLHFNDFVKS